MQAKGKKKAFFMIYLIFCLHCSCEVLKLKAQQFVHQPKRPRIPGSTTWKSITFHYNGLKSETDR